MKNLSAMGWLVVLLAANLALATLQYLRPPAVAPAPAIVVPVVPPAPDAAEVAASSYLKGFGAVYRSVAADVDAGTVPADGYEPSLGTRLRTPAAAIMAAIKAHPGGPAAGLRKAADAFDAAANPKGQ